MKTRPASLPPQPMNPDDEAILVEVGADSVTLEFLSMEEEDDE